MKSREIEIFSNEITRLDLEAGEIEFDVTCSKGTYIRTICDDIGRTLGCGAAMSSLIRTASGFFTIEDSVDIDDMAEMSDGEIRKLVMPADETLIYLGKAVLDDNRVIAFRNGNSTREGGYDVILPSEYDGLYRVYGNGAFLGVASIKKGELVPEKVLI